MFKKIWFQVHWFIGITAGTVLMFIGVTGAILSFREEITDWLNPGIVHVAVREQAMLTPPQILERLRAEVPHERVAVLIASIQPGASVRINFAPPPGVRRGEMRYADPYTGALLPPLAGNEFFEFTERFHRWLLLPTDAGKIVAGSLSMCLLILALSGLYMRWPRRALNWRAWFKLDFGLSGRSFLWNLHSVIGTWALVMYVIFTTTGMYWAFDWFKSGVNSLAGQEVRAPQARREKPKGMGMSMGTTVDKEKDKSEKTEAAPLDLTLAWNVFLREAGPYTLVNIRMSDKTAQPVQFNYLLPDASHERARNRLNVLPLTGDIKLNERFADKDAGGLFIGAIYPLHMGTYFGMPGRIVMTIAALIMPLFGITGWMLYLDRRRKKRAVRAERALLDRSREAVISSPGGANASSKESKEGILLAYATQAGQAERIALHTAAALQKAGVAVTVQSLATLDPERLRHFHRALFVVSTFGEGEPPDSARRFARQLTQPAGNALAHVQYGLLALGDRHYEKFCGFGHSLDHWLRSQGAQAFFPMIEVDDSAPSALASWQRELAVLTGGAPLEEAAPAPAEASYAGWILRERKLLNPGSAGQGIYHLEFDAPAGSHAQWQSGALAEILPRHAPDRVALFLSRTGLDGDVAVRLHGETLTLAEALSRSVLPVAKPGAGLAPQALADGLQPLASRRYSVASLQDDERVHLLVRQVAHEDGFGLASGWLTEYAPLGGAIEMRLLENSNFALAPEPTPAIFIGNGSGLAGLRGHLRARIAGGQRRNWLLFGERHRAHDFLYREEIEQWMQDDMLSRVDIAFSRDQAERVYVQDKLRQAADMLKVWLDEGAVLYVCGSLDGMAAGVDAALTDLLGEAALEDLIAQGRYRRDVY